MTLPRRLSVLILLVLAVLLPLPARAALFVPPGLNAGDPYHLVFVSSTPSTANFGGILGADAYVQNLANLAGIGNTAGVTWQAILSDSSTVPGTATDAINRFNPSAPIYNMQGQLVAASGAALWNTAVTPLVNPIAFDENGAGSATILIEVWTGTGPAGTFERADSEWLGASAGTFATAGSSVDVNSNWINGGGQPAENVPLSLFAASEVLIAPEPSRALLSLLGLGVLFARRRR